MVFGVKLCIRYREKILASNSNETHISNFCVTESPNNCVAHIPHNRSCLKGLHNLSVPTTNCATSLILFIINPGAQMGFVTYSSPTVISFWSLFITKVSHLSRTNHHNTGCLWQHHSPRKAPGLASWS